MLQLAKHARSLKYFLKVLSELCYLVCVSCSVNNSIVLLKQDILMKEGVEKGEAKAR